MGKKSEKRKDKKSRDKGKKAKKANKLLKAESKKLNKPVGQVRERVMPSAEERQRMIATAAYFIAEKHGFDPSRESENWREAESQIDEMLKSRS